jgi:cobalt-zinc-cadmium efflux system protein
MIVVAESHQHGEFRAGARHRHRLAWVLAMVVTFMVAEIVGGVLTGSLALLSDAGHMATDALGLAMSLAAIVAATRGDRSAQRTFGLYRLEILAALANAVLLFGVAGYVLYEAALRIQNPTEILSGPMLAVALIGLAVNVLAWWLLRRGADESINVEGAYLEVLADLLGSIGVIVAAIVVWTTDWLYADPIIGAAIGLFILPRAWRLGRRAIRVLVQAAPEDLDMDRLRRSLASIDGVADVHDLHVWTLTSEMNVASVHLMTPEAVDPHPVLDEARRLLEVDYGIAHATLQVEPDTHRGCAELAW